MDIHYHYVSSLDDEGLEDAIFSLLRKADDEFLPPLSTRGVGTAEENLQNILTQERTRQIIYALDEDDRNDSTVVGYLSFEDGHVAPQSNGGLPCRYVIRVIVDSAYRGNRIADGFYKVLAQLS